MRSHLRSPASKSELCLANILYHQAVAYRRNQKVILHLHRRRGGEFRKLNMTTLANKFGDTVSQLHVC